MGLALHSPAVLFLLASTGVQAGELFAASLQIEPPAHVLRRGDFGRMTFSVQNVGEDAIELAAAGFTYQSFGPASTLFPFRVAETPPCGFSLEGPSPRPGEPATNGLVLLFLPESIAVGESRSCTVGFRVSPDAAAPFVQRFAFVAFVGDRSQNIALHFAFPLGDPPPLVPTLSLLWLSLLGGLFAGIAALALRR